MDVRGRRVLEEGTVPEEDFASTLVVDEEAIVVLVRRNELEEAGMPLVADVEGSLRERFLVRPDVLLGCSSEV